MYICIKHVLLLCTVQVVVQTLKESAVKNNFRINYYLMSVYVFTTRASYTWASLSKEMLTTQCVKFCLVLFIKNNNNPLISR